MNPMLLRRGSWVGESSAPVRPVFLGSSNNGVDSAAFTVSLPAGWAAGDLAVLLISTAGTGSASVSGFTSVTSVQASGCRIQVLYRVLQSGDASISIPSGVRRSAMCLLFKGGTFSSTASVTTLSSGSGSGTAPTFGVSSVVVDAGLHLVLDAVSTDGNNTPPPITYSGPIAQRWRSVGVATFTSLICSGNDFDGGGVAPVTSFTIGASLGWVSSKVLIRGNFA